MLRLLLQRDRINKVTNFLHVIYISYGPNVEKSYNLQPFHHIGNPHVFLFLRDTHWMFLEYKNPLGFVNGLQKCSKASEIVEFGVCEYVYFL